MKRSGVYQIRNIENDHIYVGSTSKEFRKRWNIHRHLLRKQNHHSPHLQNAWNLYGEDNFVFEILEEIIFPKDKMKAREIIIKYEQIWIDSLQPEYNVCKFAGSCLGIKRSEEYKQKMSEIKSGENHPMFGKHHDEETKRKMSDAQSGEKNPMYGKTHSLKVKKILSEINSIKQIGENNGRAILIRPQVDEIRFRYYNEDVTMKQLAEEYGVSKSCVYHIIDNTSWHDSNYVYVSKRRRKI